MALGLSGRPIQLTMLSTARSLIFSVQGNTDAQSSKYTKLNSEFVLALIQTYYEVEPLI